MSRISVEIGKRIRNYRIQQKMNQEQLAEKSGMHPTYIGQLERGEKNATLESISKIASGLSLPVSVFFENIDDCENNVINYPSVAYNLIQSVSVENQEKLIEIIKTIIEMGK